MLEMKTDYPYCILCCRLVLKSREDRVRTLLLLFLFQLSGCQSQPYSHVQVGEAFPQGLGCREAGQVIGNAYSRENSRQQSIEDLKMHAAQIGANYVRLIAVAAHGSSARGIAYRCR